jgi:hypothetical protein
MAVVINEFEIVPETAPPPRAAAGPSADADGAKQKEKPDFADVLRRCHERAERVRAH